jgi:hypothetical protein
MVAVDWDSPGSVFNGTWKLATSDKETAAVHLASAMEFENWVLRGVPSTKRYSSEEWEKALVDFLDQKRMQSLSPRAEMLLSEIDHALARQQTEYEKAQKIESLYRTATPVVTSEDAYLKLKAKLDELADNAPEEAIVNLLGSPSFWFERRGGLFGYYVYLRPKPYFSIAGLSQDEAGFEVLVADGTFRLVRTIHASEVSP